MLTIQRNSCTTELVRLYGQSNTRIREGMLHALKVKDFTYYYKRKILRKKPLRKTRTRRQNNNKIACVKRIELSHGTVRFGVFVIRVTNKTISKLTDLSNTQGDRYYLNFVTTHNWCYLNSRSERHLY